MNIKKYIKKGLWTSCIMYRIETHCTLLYILYETVERHFHELIGISFQKNYIVRSSAIHYTVRLSAVFFSKKIVLYVRVQYIIQYVRVQYSFQKIELYDWVQYITLYVQVRFSFRKNHIVHPSAIHHTVRTSAVLF